LILMITSHPMDIKIGSGHGYYKAGHEIMLIPFTT
jgi:hypothetical protein